VIVKRRTWPQPLACEASACRPPGVCAFAGGGRLDCDSRAAALRASSNLWANGVVLQHFTGRSKLRAGYGRTDLLIQLGLLANSVEKNGLGLADSKGLANRFSAERSGDLRGFCRATETL
jgi:hypothetical protein